MKIIPLGAAGGEVTGSAYSVRTSQGSLLVDCGLFQGGRKSEELNHSPLPPGEPLDAVLLTHAHLDHIGRLPLLVRNGYTMPILGTPATLEMTRLILRDSARVQASDAERKNRKRLKNGEPPENPLYTAEDVEKTLQLLRPAPYGTPVPVAPGIEAIWAESGHMLGSTSIQLTTRASGATRRVVFSGDIGPRGAPILRDFESFRHADLVFLESTYGDRDHRPYAETVSEFVALVKAAVESGGKVLVPVFAVGRAQLVISLLAWMFRHGKVRPFPIFLDSPMAIEATEIYYRHQNLFDEEMQEFLRERPLRADLTTLTNCVTAEESKAINDFPGSCLILAGSGMCTGGRILHHLKAHLWKPETQVLIVGFQTEGTLGRRLVNGEPLVRIFGEEVAVKAQIHTLGGFSAHAGQTDLLAWLEVMAASHPRVALTHGENDQRKGLAAAIERRFRLQARLPVLGETIEV
ncbi:MAG: MBL fold metallo-hydrolase [Verrucomicrobiae bacterium]|nr:MBL fold metallo-hydrolase [Verrucomicrobiae bacterium]